MTSQSSPLDLEIPPHSIEAEQSLIGGLLRDNSAWDRIASHVQVEDFYRHDHRLIFGQVIKLINAGRPADVITVFEALRDIGKHEEIGGLQYLNAMAQNTPSAANIGRYAEIVRSKGLARRLLVAAFEIADSVRRTDGRDIQSLLDDAESKILAVSEAGQKTARESVRIQDLLTKVVERVDELYTKGATGDVVGLPTGFIDLDRVTTGLQPGDLVVVAGRPSMGKTSFSMNIAENVAIEAKLPVAVFSMEMGGEQLALRSIGSVGGIDSHRMRTGQLQEEDWPRLTHAIQRMNDVVMEIDETPNLTHIELRARARRIARKVGKLGLIIVDYLQLMNCGDEGSDNRATEIGNITRALKGLAKELHCPVIVLSQLNRSLESRTNKRPVMSDLRESGAIEQDADVIMFVYRDEVYNPDSPDKGTAEIIISKQRTGPIGTVRLTWQGAYTKFSNYSSAGRTAFTSD